MIPKVAPCVKLGLPRIGVLVTLMNWARNSTLALSVMGKRFAALTSAVVRPGPRNEPIAQFPKVFGNAGATDAGFHHCLPKRGGVTPADTIAPLPSLLTPRTQVARGENESAPELSGPAGLMAKPVCRVKSAATVQPPMMALTTSLASPPNILPLPKGISYTR